MPRCKMMPNRLALPVFILGYVAVCAEGRPTFKPYTDVEAYRVYGAILSGVAPWSGALGVPVLIRSDTVAGFSGATAKRCLANALGDPVIRQLAAEFDHVNGKPRILQPRFPMAKTFELHEIDDLRRSYTEWVEFSAVGFNHSRTRALVYVTRHINGLGSQGGFMALEKVGSNWQHYAFTGVDECGWIA